MVSPPFDVTGYGVVPPAGMNEIVACTGTAAGFVIAKSDTKRVPFRPPALTVPGTVHVVASTDIPMNRTQRRTAVITAAFRMVKFSLSVMRK
jgi:hypothetical protein